MEGFAVGPSQIRVGHSHAGNTKRRKYIYFPSHDLNAELLVATNEPSEFLSVSR